MPFSFDFNSTFFFKWYEIFQDNFQFLFDYFKIKKKKNDFTAESLLYKLNAKPALSRLIYFVCPLHWYSWKKLDVPISIEREYIKNFHWFALRLSNQCIFSCRFDKMRWIDMSIQKCALKIINGWIRKYK